MSEKGFSEGRLAAAAGVDVKTVGRWVRGESLPQAMNARATADALSCDPQALWPDMFPTMRPPGTGTVAVSVYGSRADVPVTVWAQLFDSAVEQIDILVYGGTFLSTASRDSARCSLQLPSGESLSGSSLATRIPPR
jgi:transcriptional regulator with XRE-family HTH domain